jgi:aspartyl-tRNA(Asn)/glutamyl-tRNA(Gln) amidotransferase subunit A
VCRTSVPQMSSGTTPEPWLGDACSLVEAFRSGERSPAEELASTLAAIEASELNAVCHLDVEAAERAAVTADTSMPFGGVPLLVKEAEAVTGWPWAYGSAVFADRTANHTAIHVDRLVRRGGANLLGQTTSSEFGGVNLTRTVVHGATRNPWNLSKTPGGSSGGAGAAVAGGLAVLATGGDGGGSIRIPAGFTGLVGLKATFGRIPRGPHQQIGNYTVTVGGLTRSVRDTARWFDVCNGHDPHDPFSLPRVEGWETGLGHHTETLHGLRVAVVPDWGGATVSPAVWEMIEDAAQHLVDIAGLQRIASVDTSIPRMGAAWSISGMLAVHADLADHWPDCAELLTPEIRFGMETTLGRYNGETRARIESRRADLNDRMASIFDPADGVDLVITATNPDVAFDAEGPLPGTFGGVTVGPGNNGLLTFPANLHGNPAISIPAGTLDGLPVGLQVVGRHFTEPLLLELALLMERSRPWALVAPGSPL